MGELYKMSYGMYPCPICGFECDSYEEAQECKKQHEEEKQKEKCPYCGKISEYTKKEWKNKWDTKCKYCGHSLTITM